jgi:hypothetical protein
MQKSMWLLLALVRSSTGGMLGTLSDLSGPFFSFGSGFARLTSRAINDCPTVEYKCRLCIEPRIPSETVMPHLFVEQGRIKGTQFPLGPDKTVLEREKECDICLPNRIRGRESF